MIRYPVGAGDGSRAALARDPDGEWVELVVLPNPTDAELTRFEIGLTVADLDASRAFYRDLIGLVERGPVYDDLLGTQKYTYRHGATIDRPLSAPGTMRTVWLDDPDGNSNYFAGYADQDNSLPAASE